MPLILEIDVSVLIEYYLIVPQGLRSSFNRLNSRLFHIVGTTNTLCNIMLKKVCLFVGIMFKLLSQSKHIFKTSKRAAIPLHTKEGKLLRLISISIPQWEEYFSNTTNEICNKSQKSSPK